MRQRLLTLLRLLPVLGPWGACSLLCQKIARRNPIAVRVCDHPFPLLARPNNSDLSVLYQVFGLRECEVSLDSAPGFIIDGGANVGYSTAYLAHRYPSARVLAVEPSGDNCALLRLNTEHLPNVTVVQGAIWHSHASLLLSNPSERGWMIQVREAGDSTSGTVPAFTMQDLLARSTGGRADILKLDIEGAETDLFSKGDLSWIEQIGCLIIEVHGDAARSVVSTAMVGRGFHCEVSGEKLVFRRAPLASDSVRSG